MKRGLVVCALACSPALSEAQAVGLHLLSAHAQPGFEAATPGLYWRGPSGLTLGLLRNSQGLASAYVARTWESDSGRWAVTLGGITGYRGVPLAPMVVPSVRVLKVQDLTLRLAYIPKPPRQGGSSALHLALELPLAP